MSRTTAAEVQDQTPQIWSTELYAEAESLTFWHNMEGPEGSSMPIIRKDDLTKKAGDTIQVDLILALKGAGVTSDVEHLKGNEEKLTFRHMKLTVAELSHAVAWTEFTEQTITHAMRANARGQLAKWLSGKYDDAIFDEFTGAGSTVIPTKNKWAAGTATSRDTVADTNAGGRLTWDTLMELKAYAQVELKIEPIRLENGEELFLLVAHPYALLALKEHDTKWAQAQREARERGAANPLFTGAAGMVEGVILRPSLRAPRSVNTAGTPIQVADNVLVGAQAMSRGYAMYPDWREDMDEDYGRKPGVATVSIKGEKLNVFDLTAAGNAADADKTAVGSMVVYTSAVAPNQP